MSGLGDIALGIMTALGGFLDIGELVFAMQSGAKFQYLMLWVIVVGTAGIIIFSEMSGRIAAVLGRPTFELIRERLGHKTGITVLIASNIVNLLTCAAEIGGIAIVLQLFFGFEYRIMLLAAALLLFCAIWFLKFRWIERVFGVLGLLLLVYGWAAIALQPEWDEVLKGFVPRPPAEGMPGMLVYGYFAVGLFSSILMPYEVYFYSSGGIEDKWTPKEIPVNLVTALVGFSLGGILTMAIVVVGAAVFFPRGVDPQVLSSSALPAVAALGTKGLVLALLGMLFAIGGAAVETALAGAYNVAQFFGWPWGKAKKPRQVPRFTAAWIAMLVAGLAIAMSDVNPVTIVETSVIFAVVVLPFTYYPILRVAGDPKLMKSHANNKFVSALGWAYFVLIVLAALSAVPLMYLTHMGEG
jgi:Mn2+/Fe2+ NRAMP family transporter